MNKVISIIARIDIPAQSAKIFSIRASLLILALPFFIMPLSELLLDIDSGDELGICVVICLFIFNITSPFYNLPYPACLLCQRNIVVPNLSIMTISLLC